MLDILNFGHACPKFKWVFLTIVRLEPARSTSLLENFFV
jgi:hypothetical protein